MKTRSYQPDLLIQPDHSQRYILRLWRADQSTAADWRASLESLETGQRIGFASLEQLFAYLIDQCERNADRQQVIDQRNQDEKE
jgi:hypothetical protein